MLIAFTNFESLEDVQHRDSELQNHSLYKNKKAFKEFPFIVLGKEDSWLSYKNLPENFKESAAIVSFDFYNYEIDDFWDEIKKLLTTDFRPFTIILHLTKHHENITKFINQYNPINYPFHYTELRRHIPESDYKIIIDMLLDAPHKDCTNHKFVHDKILPLRKRIISSAINSLIANLCCGNESNLDPILLPYHKQYEDFLSEINRNYDPQNPNHIEKRKSFKEIVEKDEYIELV